jgi:hypothetical protein
VEKSKALPTQRPSLAGRYGSAANSSPESDAESIKSVVAGLLVYCQVLES